MASGYRIKQQRSRTLLSLWKVLFGQCWTDPLTYRERSWIIHIDLASALIAACFTPTVSWLGRESEQRQQTWPPCLPGFLWDPEPCVLMEKLAVSAIPLPFHRDSLPPVKSTSVSNGGKRRRNGQFSSSQWFTCKQFQLRFWFRLPEGARAGPWALKEAHGSPEGDKTSEGFCLRARSAPSRAPLPASPSRGRRSSMFWVKTIYAIIRDFFFSSSDTFFVSSIPRCQLI